MYLDLVGMYGDSTVNHFLHVLSVEVAETYGGDPLILRQESKSIDVCWVVIL
jgi:hypothetical protein